MKIKYNTKLVDFKNYTEINPVMYKFPIWVFRIYIKFLRIVYKKPIVFRSGGE